LLVCVKWQLIAARNHFPKSLANWTQPTSINTSAVIIALQPNRQSPYLHKLAIVTVTSFSLWRHAPVPIMTSFATELATPTITDTLACLIYKDYWLATRQIEETTRASPYHVAEHHPAYNLTLNEAVDLAQNCSLFPLVWKDNRRGQVTQATTGRIHFTHPTNSVTAPKVTQSTDPTREHRPPDSSFLLFFITG